MKKIKNKKIKSTMEPQLGHATTTNSFKKKTYAQPLMRNTMPPCYHATIDFSFI